LVFFLKDERFELDLVIDRNQAAIRALEPIMKHIQTSEEELPSRLRPENALEVLHIKSIERIYGDKGREILDSLFTQPRVTVPLILKRLKQKDLEWIKVRRELNKSWREVAEKNYYKSLDHQSFYFKQNDKKNLAPKVLVAEIKQKYQEKLKEKEKAKQQAAAKVTTSTTPTHRFLRFPFPFSSRSLLCNEISPFLKKKKKKNRTRKWKKRKLIRPPLRPSRPQPLSLPWKLTLKNLQPPALLLPPPALPPPMSPLLQRLRLRPRQAQSDQKASWANPSTISNIP
jgi:hypothetical protein